MRKWVIAAATAILTAGPTALALYSGGYFDRARLIAAIVAWGLVLVVALLTPDPLPRSTPARFAVAGLALLSAWTALSLAWAPLAGRALDDLQRLVLYLGFFIAAISLMRVPSARRWLEPAMIAGTLIVALYGLSERLLPGLIELDRSITAAGRLELPITYGSALGLLAAIGFVLALRVAGDPDRVRALRGAAAAAGVPLGLAVYLTFARGALAAVVVGVLVLIALAPAGWPQVRSVLIVGPATIVAALFASRLPTVESLARGEVGDPGEGLLMLSALVVLALIAAAGVVRHPTHELLLPSLPFSRPAVVWTLGALLALGVLGATILEGKPKTVSPAPGVSPARLGSIDTNRYRYWEVAIENWADRPLIGLGSGGFLVEWLKERDRVDTSGEAHSVYLETAAELGLAGLAFLLLFMGGVCAAAVRLYWRDPSTAVGPTVVLLLWAVHAGLDWDWEIPAVSLTALLAAAAAIAWSEEGAPVRRPRGGRSRSARNVAMRATTGVCAAMTALALVLPAGALGQSAGDENYIDPFQEPERIGQDDGPQGGSRDQGSQSPPSAPEPTPAPAQEPPVVVAQDGTAAGTVGPTLPRTGLAVGAMIGSGVLLLASGLALRRRLAQR